jgi:hypothetical protein
VFVWVLVAQGLKDTPGNNVPIIIILCHTFFHIFNLLKIFFPQIIILCAGFVLNVNQ